MIWFDFDGVLADFWSTCVLHAHPVAVEHGFRGTPEEFYELGWSAPRDPVRAAVPRVDYKHVKPLEGGLGALRWALDEYGPDEVAVLTSCPPRLAHHYEQKGAWLRRRGIDVEVVGCHRKGMVARPGAVLFDDLDKQVHAFRERGGTAYHVPTPYGNGPRDETRAKGPAPPAEWFVNRVREGLALGGLAGGAR